MVGGIRPLRNSSRARPETTLRRGTTGIVIVSVDIPVFHSSPNRTNLYQLATLHTSQQIASYLLHFAVLGATRQRHGNGTEPTERNLRNGTTVQTRMKSTVLRLLYVFRVCLLVCASALITCTMYYVIRYYATAVYSSFWRFAGQVTTNEGNFVLPSWRKRGR